MFPPHWKTLTQTQIQRQEPNTDTSIRASDVLTSTTLVKRESIDNVQYVPCKYLTQGFVDYHVDELIRRRNWPTHFICPLLSHTTATLMANHSVNFHGQTLCGDMCTHTCTNHTQSESRQGTFGSRDIKTALNNIDTPLRKS